MPVSFRVTRDEQHLTRGRANTLRLALSGQLGANALTSEPVARGARPVRVLQGLQARMPDRRRHGEDEDRVRSTSAAHEHGLTLQGPADRHLPRYAPWARAVAVAVQPAQRCLAGAREPCSGFAREARAAEVARRHVPRDDRAGRQPIATKSCCSSTPSRNYFEPENARAALRVLEAAGYRVAVAWPTIGARALCCGRTFLAAGLVDEAQREARRMLEALAPSVARGVPIVGLEPSCLLTLRDEFLVDGLRRRAAHRTADNAFLFEEFLAREQKAGRLALDAEAAGRRRRALLHGHCHQKAFDAMAAVQEVLALVPELEVKPIESSCCGMAGSFGYEAEHYDVSMAMAELSLLPAVRKADADTLIVADGTSCRHQIADGAERDALHVAQVLERALG